MAARWGLGGEISQGENSRRQDWSSGAWVLQMDKQAIRVGTPEREERRASQGHEPKAWLGLIYSAWDTEVMSEQWTRSLPWRPRDQSNTVQQEYNGNHICHLKCFNSHVKIKW